MKKSLTLLALAGTTLLSANPYYQGSCPGGQCGYQNQGYYQNPGSSYYQGQDQGYYQQPNQGYQQSGQVYYQQPGQGYQQSGQMYYQQPGQGYQQSGQMYYQQPGQGYYQGEYEQGMQGMQGMQGGYEGFSGNQPQGQYFQGPSNQGPGQGYGPQGNHSQVNTSDVEIAKNVHSVLSSGWFAKGYQEVTFDVANGVVSLRGSVENQDDKRKIEESVKKIDGVKQVNNQITIRPEKAAYNYHQPSMNMNMTADTGNKVKTAEKTYPQDYAVSDSDKQINAQIRDKLSGSWTGKGYETVVFKTSNGVVTITGFVEKFDDIQKINDAVKKISGVKNVNNQLSVRSK